MPELKRTFTGGRMEKDLDERILPNGQYREALNIGVATSEDSEVGAAQNILGNIKVTSATSSTTYNPNLGTFGNEHVGYNNHIAEIIDPQTDMLYRFVHTPNYNEGVWMDRIVEYDTSKGLKDPWEEKEHAIMIDVFKVTAKVSDHDCVCIGSNKSKITVELGKVNYLRWGMLVTMPGSSGSGGIPTSEGVTVEEVNYTTGVITLSKPIWTTVDPPNAPVCNQCLGCNNVVTFTGDRNLNFSNSNTITGINIIDGMIFWTDNMTEPKKVNIRRGKIGSISEDNRSFDGIFGKDIGRSRESQTKISDFNQPTLLIVDDEKKDDCMQDEAFCPILGCTDVMAVNWNPVAVYDDGSCCYVGGCTDATLVDDANGVKPGETNYITTYYYCNYNPDACFDDGTCASTSCGCTDILACNYDPSALIDDGSCEGYYGCTDPLSEDYDPSASCDGGTCRYKWDCVEAGYGVNSCSFKENGISKADMAYTAPSASGYLPNSTTSVPQVHPADYTGGMAYVGGTGASFSAAIYVNPMESFYTIPNDNIYQNNPANSGTSNAGTPITSVYNMGVTAGLYFPGGLFDGEDIGSKPFKVQVADTFTTAMADSDFCVTPVDQLDYTQGSLWQKSLDAIIVPSMFAQIDGMGMEEWMSQPTKSGNYVLVPTMGGAGVWNGPFTAGSPTPWPLLTAGGGLLNGTRGASADPPGQGHPAMDFAFTIGRQNCEDLGLPVDAITGAYWVAYQDTNGKLWSRDEGGMLQSNGWGGGWFHAHYCFGTGCAGYEYNWISNPLQLDTNGGNLINMGTTAQDMVTVLRANGFGPRYTDHTQQYQPAQISKYSCNTTDFCLNSGTPLLMPQYHGMVELLGNTSWSSYIQNTYIDGNPDNATGFSGGGGGGLTVYGDNNLTLNGFFADGTSGYDFTLNYGAWPEVTQSMGLEEIMAQVTNNKLGWTDLAQLTGGGDVSRPNDFQFIYSDCQCGTYVYGNTCQQVVGGPYNDQADCITLSGCTV